MQKIRFSLVWLRIIVRLFIGCFSYDELHAMKYQKGKLEPVDISGIIGRRKMFTMILKDREGNLWLGSYDYGIYNLL